MTIRSTVQRSIQWLGLAALVQVSVPQGTAAQEPAGCLWPRHAPTGALLGFACAADTAAASSGSDTTTRVQPALPASPFPRGRPDNYRMQQGLVLAGGGALSFGVILLLPEEISKWSKDEGFAPSWSNFTRAFTRPPVWDEDAWPVNLVGHPVIGMHTYLMERNFGATPLRSFLFSTGASVGWEYLIESWAEQPSVQDLLFTSTIGSVLGELNYQATQRLRRNGLRPWQKVVLTVLNPHHAVYQGYR